MCITAGQKGIISCLAFCPDYSGAYAAGSYSSSVGIYVEDQRGSVLELPAVAGVTCMRWSPCGNMLWVGCRRHPDLVCWDIRQTGMELGRYLLLVDYYCSTYRPNLVLRIFFLSFTVRPSIHLLAFLMTFPLSSPCSCSSPAPPPVCSLWCCVWLQSNPRPGQQPAPVLRPRPLGKVPRHRIPDRRVRHLC